MIVGVNGVSEAGKDSIGRICVEEWGCKHLAFATRMKEFAMAVNPWVPIDHMIKPDAFTNVRGQFIRLRDLVERVGWDTAKQNPEVRRLLQGFGHGGREVLDPALWVKQVSPFVRGKQHFVITDVRYINESEWIRNHGGVVVRVERPGYGPALGHVSDVHEDSLWDEVIHNNGTLDDLRKTVIDRLGEYFDDQ